MADRMNAAELPSDTPHVVIVGGGITGLSAAFYLQQAARAAGIALSYTLVERDDRLGGKIHTDTIDGAAYGAPGAFVVEAGPDSFIVQKPEALQLVHDLGLADRIMDVNEQRRSVHVLVKGRRIPLPDGLSLLAPTKLLPFALSPLISLRGKLRMALDLLIPPRRDDADETLADFVRRRFGSEALDKIGEPLLAGIHSSEAERQSMMATFPRFRALERKHGSLIRGMRAHRPPPGSRPSPFATLRGGVGELVAALARALDGRLLAGRGVASLSYLPSEDPAYRLRLDDGATLAADAVILTAPAFAAAELVAPFQPDLAEGLRQIRYATTATVSLAYPRAAVGDALDAVGLIIPRSEGCRINACTITSVKFSHRAPGDYALLRVFFGGARNPDVVALDDAAIVALARDELRAIYGIAADPLFSRIYRWQRSNPQYELGHLERVDALDRACPPGLLLAGSAYRGVGIPDCIRQGREAAERAVADLRERVQRMRFEQV